MPTTVVSEDSLKLLHKKQIDLNTRYCRLQDIVNYMINRYIDLVTDDKLNKYYNDKARVNGQGTEAQPPKEINKSAEGNVQNGGAVAKGLLATGIEEGCG